MGTPMENSLPYDPVRMLAWKILQEIERSSFFADFALDQAFFQTPDLKPLDRAMISEMVMGVLRWRGRLDVHLQQLLKSRDKKVDARLMQLLRLGAYQLLFMDRVPESAAVNESVRLAKALFKNEKIAGFVNALLRSVIRNKNRDFFPSFAEKPVEHMVQFFSHPPWLVERWVKDFGPEVTLRICAANNQKPPFTIRTNTLKITREALHRRLQEDGISAQPTPYSPDGLTLARAPDLTKDPLFQGGMYFIQDESSQMISFLLDPQPGEQILDACAAPGGKTTHLAQLMGNRGEIFALDLLGSKMKLIRENCHRLGVTSVQIMEGDATQPLPIPEGMDFHRVLVDAPCSGLGILHRNPEAKWRRKPEDIPRLAKVQAALLDRASSCLKPGGTLVYSTCTMTPEENERGVETFLARHTDFEREDLSKTAPLFMLPLVSSEGFFRTYPERVMDESRRMDGFFAARLRKT